MVDGDDLPGVVEDGGAGGAGGGVAVVPDEVAAGRVVVADLDDVVLADRDEFFGVAGVLDDADELTWFDFVDPGVEAEEAVLRQGRGVVVGLFGQGDDGEIEGFVGEEAVLGREREAAGDSEVAGGVAFIAELGGGAEGFVLGAEDVVVGDEEARGDEKAGTPVDLVAEGAADGDAADGTGGEEAAFQVVDGDEVVEADGPFQIAAGEAAAAGGHVLDPGGDDGGGIGLFGEGSVRGHVEGAARLDAGGFEFGDERRVVMRARCGHAEPPRRWANADPALIRGSRGWVRRMAAVNRCLCLRILHPEGAGKKNALRSRRRDRGPEDLPHLRLEGGVVARVGGEGGEAGGVVDEGAGVEDGGGVDDAVAAGVADGVAVGVHLVDVAFARFAVAAVAVDGVAVKFIFGVEEVDLGWAGGGDDFDGNIWPLKVADAAEWAGWAVGAFWDEADAGAGVEVLQLDSSDAVREDADEDPGRVAGGETLDNDLIACVGGDVEEGGNDVEGAPELVETR